MAHADPGYEYDAAPRFYDFNWGGRARGEQAGRSIREGREGSPAETTLQLTRAPPLGA